MRLNVYTIVGAIIIALVVALNNWFLFNADCKYFGSPYVAVPARCINYFIEIER